MMKTDSLLFNLIGLGLCFLAIIVVTLVFKSGTITMIFSSLLGLFYFGWLFDLIKFGFKDDPHD